LAQLRAQELVHVLAKARVTTIYTTPTTRTRQTAKRLAGTFSPTGSEHADIAALA